MGFRPTTDGAGQELLANINAATTLFGGTVSNAAGEDYTSMDWLTESTGRKLATAVSDLTTAVKTYKVKVDGIDEGANAYELPVATSSVLGGVMLGSDTTQTVSANTVSSTGSRTYAVQANSSGQLVVNVPWTDNNTTYSAGTGISFSGTTINHSNSVTAGSTQSNTSATLAYGGTFYIPQVTYDAQGHITAVSYATMKLPASDNTDTNYYPTTWTWTAGTTSGPTASLSGSGMSAVSVAAVPSASSSASGVVTTGAQTFAGTKTFSSTIGGDISGNAATATKLAASKTIRTNLASTSTASFDGSENITPGVTGTLPVGNGGTGKSAAVGSTSKPVYLSSSGIAEASNVYASCLEDMSWDEISEISLAGKAPSIFHVGQEKTIELSSGETVTAVILGFNHDDLADGSGKAGITFGLKNALKTTYAMNSSSTNAGGWTSSVMRATRMATFKGYLPSDLQAVLQTVTKSTSEGSASSTIETTEDELFLFSQVEVFGTYYYNQGDSPTQRSYVGEGHQYDYYKGKTWNSYYAKYAVDPFGTARTYTALVYYQENGYKGLGDSATASYGWWLRSPVYGNSTYFCLVNGTGNCGTNGASATYGVVFGFCV